MPSGGNNKLTKEQYLNRLKQYTDDEFIMPDGYLGKRIKVSIINNTRDIKYYCAPEDFLARYKNNPNYPEDSRSVKYSKEHCQELLDEYCPGFAVIDFIKKESFRTHEIVIQCKNSNHKPIRKTCFNLERGGCVCPDCDLEDRLNKIYPNDSFIPLEPYIKGNIHMDILHTQCGRVWRTTPSNILKGNGCALCGRENMHKANLKEHESFINEISNKLVGYEVLDKYVNGLADMHVKHLECGRITVIKPSIVRKKERVSLCKWCNKEHQAKLRTKRHNDFVNEVEGNFPNQFEIISEYINAKKEITVKHLACGNIYTIIANHLLNHGSCATCSTSMGEKIINRVLTKNNVIFEKQKKFDGLVGLRNGKLSYDFYIQREQNDVLIEFNGIQHYEYSKFFHNSFEDFRKQINHDKLKENFAKENNIELVIIPYWDINNIENILIEKLRLNNINKTA